MPSTIYEDLYEMCPFYGGEAHQFEVCLELCAQKKIQVFVENFDTQAVLNKDGHGARSGRV